MTKTTRGPVERLVSAGGIVCREGDGATEMVLCGRGDPTMWALPKGTPAEGESLEETAMREVSEETGLEVEIVEPLGQISYWFYPPQGKGRCFKTVHFYLMRSMGGSLANHDPEFDEVRWFPSEEAPGKMAYPNEADLVKLALEKVKAALHKNS